MIDTGPLRARRGPPVGPSARSRETFDHARRTHGRADDPAMAHPSRSGMAPALAEHRSTAERRRLIESLILAFGIGGFSIVLLLANGPI